MSNKKITSLLKKESAKIKEELVIDLSKRIDRKARKYTNRYFSGKVNKRINKIGKDAYVKWRRKTAMLSVMSLVAVFLIIAIGGITLVNRIEKNANDKINAIILEYQKDLSVYKTLLENSLDSISAANVEVMYREIDKEIQSERIQENIQLSINRKVQELAPMLIERVIEKSYMDSLTRLNMAYDK